MHSSSTSIFILTILLAIGLAFFLRAASKDRTTVVDVVSPLPPLDVLNGITDWLKDRGWKMQGGDPGKKVLRFNGNVSFADNNITNVGSLALDSISADGTGITINDKLTLKKEAFMKTLHQSWVLGG